MAECGDLNIVTGWLFLGLGVLFGMVLFSILSLVRK